jgi:hypothetical protein
MPARITSRAPTVRHYCPGCKTRKAGRDFYWSRDPRSHGGKRRDAYCKPCKRVRQRLLYYRARKRAEREGGR